MIRFGYFYLNGRLTVYDVSIETRHGRQVYVAALSEDPRVCFSAIRPEHAIEQLREYLDGTVGRPMVRQALTTPRATVY